MLIKKLELKNFRNYSDINLNLNYNKILFTGKNAQGKTNLLEAVYYLSNLNSLRNNNDGELIKRNENYCSISSEIQKFDVDINLEIIINPPERKKLKINGISKNKSSQFISTLQTVCFTVNDMLLTRGTPDDRRKWLDEAISRIYPAYFERLSKYNKIRTQKNNYLKNLKGSVNEEMLDIWNEQLAVTGSNIIFIRLNFLYGLEKKAKEKHSQISDTENLSILYSSMVTGDIFCNNKSDFKNELILKNFKEKLEEKKQEEIIRCQSIIGPHRDDIIYLINDIEAKKFASQGQQRTLVLSLKLAELELIKEKINTNAVLLLDDVLAELDDLRQNFLLDAIGDETQTIITSVDTLKFKKDYLKTVMIFEIKNGTITKNDRVFY